MPHCKHCNATIIWNRTGDGKYVPMNPDLITVHWATCGKKADELLPEAAGEEGGIKAEMDRLWPVKEAKDE